ncbi:GNAT family N-acetyltransferase [Gramella jeungdoensis]|uniref:GNAT family N-acetyltransferase n=1 Tax=Gramella jeungdoensis TaxID=708091 RepID=A0ABT0Z065_9FLAO|nr:GNAT family protein [Gramella jeungdoensis]MCM8569111.1 GNAT family N-acetyltransferase [Gramella jeungdoensis]
MNFKTSILLENERLYVQPLEIKHFNDLKPIALNHPGLLKYSPSPFGNEENLKAYIENAISERRNQRRYPFVIFDKKLNRFTGSTSFGNISIKDKRLEIGWTWLDPKVQGTGLNKSCKHLLLQYCFDQIGFERVEFKIDSRNLQSRRAVEKIGAIFEGELRSHTLMADGFRRNTVYYSILKKEWQKLKETIFKEFNEKNY